jgi:actin beta/gamma 1
MAIDVAGAALVLEVGSNMCRVGFAQQDVPSVVFPSLVGRIRHPALMQVVPRESFGRFFTGCL